MRKVVLAFFVFLVVGGILITQLKNQKQSSSFTYVITETSGPTSFDPLEADNTSNLPPARMIYATPLEASDESQLTSRVLSSFTYNTKTKLLEWTVKDGLQFEDGAPITADEIAFAVARMAFSRPKFPVIKSIAGLNQWLETKNGLKTYPAGLRIEGNKIFISFDEEVDHPMFRFCLELFSIIPKRCVDLNNGKINCDKIPASGHYRLENTNTNELVFVKRNDSKIGGLNTPKKITFKYLSPESFASQVDAVLGDNVVVAGNELQYSVETIKMLTAQKSLKHLPASRFATIQLNQNTEAFKDKNCRLYFANIFRQVNYEITNQPIESSIFTKVLLAYESLSDMNNTYSLTEKEIEKCKKHFQESKIKWGYSESEKGGLFFQVLTKTFERLNAPITTPIVFKNRADHSSAYAAATVDIFNAGSGFWALDPSGDLKMLFTPKLHKALEPITEDKNLQDLLAKIDGSKESFAKVNRYLFQDAKFNIYTHPRRFFVAKDRETLAELPFAVTSPAPWQVFKVQ
ncbi:MAG: hypothetical protein H6623_06905 [Bdellovibrionaceae bacterium]|nr:hypothetical protein [Pseudobdellovibrionaceae bacterium]